MGQVEAVELAFVVRHDIVAVFEGVVAAAIFDGVALDAAG